MPPRSDSKPEGIEAREELFSPFGPAPLLSSCPDPSTASGVFHLHSRLKGSPGYKMSRYRDGQAQEDRDKGYPVDELGIARR